MCLSYLIEDSPHLKSAGILMSFFIGKGPHFYYICFICIS